MLVLQNAQEQSAQTTCDTNPPVETPENKAEDETKAQRTGDGNPVIETPGAVDMTEDKSKAPATAVEMPGGDDLTEDEKKTLAAALEVCFLFLSFYNFTSAVCFLSIPPH